MTRITNLPATKEQTHIYFKNNDVNKHNEKMLLSSADEVHTVAAIKSSSPGTLLTICFYF